MFEEFGINAGYVEDLHALWLQSPQGVDEKWRDFFGASGTQRTHGGDPAPATLPPREAQSRPVAAVHLDMPNESLPPPSVLAEAEAGGRVYALINAYRVRGHLYANVDPIGAAPSGASELDLANYGLSDSDLDRTFPTLNLGGVAETATLRDIIAHLRETYCGSIGVEFTHIESPEMRVWLREQMESSRNRANLGKERAIRILTKLTDAEAFEQFLAKNFVGEKRFSAEGAESLIAMLDVLIQESGDRGVEEALRRRRWEANSPSKRSRWRAQARLPALVGLHPSRRLAELAERGGFPLCEPRRDVVSSLRRNGCPTGL